nr:MAG TPA: Cell Wall Hydrolase [Caudoviricetes sp.]
MKRTTRYAVVGIGLALFGLAGCMGVIFSPFESSHEAQPVQYTIKTEPIEESKFESVESQYIYVEPQIVEQESKIDEPEIEYYESPINLTEDDRWFIESVMAGECAYESYEGKLAVAQCYFDAMIKGGLTAREVKEVYQYDGWNPDLDKQDRKMYIEVMDAVHDIFDMGQFVTEKPILFFYAPRWCTSEWHEAQNLALEIGGHRFFYLTEDENAEWANILLTNVNECGMIEP